MAGRNFGLDKRAFAFNSVILSLVFVAFRACICFSVKARLPLIFDLEIFFLGFDLGFALVFALGFGFGFALALVLALGAGLALDSGLTTFLRLVAPVLLVVAFLLGEVVVLPV